MAFCYNCGKAVDAGMKFCPYCGVSLASGTTDTTSTSTDTATSSTTDSCDYKIIINSLGTCGKTDAKKLITEIMGYTADEAATLIKNLPCEIAVNLTLEQAQYLAQAFSEYGMQLAVMKGDEYVDLGSGAVSSVYSKDGTLLAHVAASLALLSVANRVHDMTHRPPRPGIADHLFMPMYHRPAPPPRPRRSIFGLVSPRPAPRVAARPNPRPASPGMTRGPGGRGGMGGGPGGGRGGMGGGPGGMGGGRGAGGGGRSGGGFGGRR